MAAAVTNAAKLLTEVEAEGWGGFGSSNSYGSTVSSGQSYGGSSYNGNYAKNYSTNPWATKSGNSGFSG